MDMIARLPELADDALTTLGTNAQRLMQTGTPKQRKAAEELLPAIRAEMDVREARKPARRPRKAPTRRVAASA